MNKLRAIIRWIVMAMIKAEYLKYGIDIDWRYPNE